MSTLINEKEIKHIFEEFIKDNKIKMKDKPEYFRQFLNFLEIDFYDWCKDNLKCYFFNN